MTRALEDRATGRLARQCPELGARSAAEPVRVCALHSLRVTALLCGCSVCEHAAFVRILAAVCVVTRLRVCTGETEPREPARPCHIYTAFTVKWFGEHQLPACYISGCIYLRL